MYPSHHHGVTILCVDDEERALVVRKMVLESAGYTVLTADNVLKALEIFKNRHVDLVITDHLLQRETGTDLAMGVRRLSPSLPIVVLTGAVEFIGCVDPPDYYLHKLEGPAEMIAKVRSITDTIVRA